jgi:hypothetical protein
MLLEREKRGVAAGAACRCWVFVQSARIGLALGARARREGGRERHEGWSGSSRSPSSRRDLQSRCTADLFLLRRIELLVVVRCWD